MLQRLRAARGALILVAVLGAGAYALYRHPPLQAVGRGEIGLRTNLLTGDVTELRDGGVGADVQPSMSIRPARPRPRSARGARRT